MVLGLPKLSLNGSGKPRSLSKSSSEYVFTLSVGGRSSQRTASFIRRIEGSKRDRRLAIPTWDPLMWSVYRPHRYVFRTIRATSQVLSGGSDKKSLYMRRIGCIQGGRYTDQVVPYPPGKRTAGGHLSFVWYLRK